MTNTAVLEGDTQENATLLNRKIAERLRVRMASLDVTASELARRAALKPSFLYDIMSGKSTNPSVVKLARIADELGVGLSYLLGNEAEERRHAFKAENTPASYSGEWLALEWLLQPDQARPALAKPFLFHHQQLQWITQNSVSTIDIEKLRFFQVQGNAMMPLLAHGHVALVNLLDRQPSPPGLFVVFDGAGLVIKRVEPLAGSKPLTVRLMVDNPTYPTVEQEADQLECIGRVIWVGGTI